jgi:DNA modification methylase
MIQRRRAYTILTGDAREVLGTLADESVHCVVTSPPYCGRSDYGTEPTVWGGDAGCEHEWGTKRKTRCGRNDGDRARLSQGSYSGGGDDKYYVGKQASNSGQLCRLCGAWRGSLGLEPTPELYVEHLVDVFREVRRVLRRDGTLWLNIGDCYSVASTHKGGGKTGPLDSKASTKAIQGSKSCPFSDGLKPKDLVGIPWCLAFALRADGWYLRSDIIWAKPNPMPESCRDRPTKAHEYVFLLTKSSRYFWDQEAVREKHANPKWTAEALQGRWKRSSRNKNAPERNDAESVSEGTPYAARINPAGRNVRSVWTIPTQPFPEAHFATFPEALPERCIRAGTSERGCCPECGAFWERVTEKTRTFESGSGHAGNLPFGKNGPELQGGGETGDVRRGPCVSSRTIGWEPSCDCANIDAVQAWDVPEAAAQAPPHDPVPCTVLDPFIGSGTTAIVAVRLDRRAVGIDLSPEYTDMVERQLAVVTPGVGAKRPRKFKLKARRRL